MSDSLLFILILLCALGAGLMAGVFFAFSVFVMAALARLPAPQGIAAMQAINVAVLNRIFLGVFFGTGVVSAVVVVIALSMWPHPGVGWLIAGAMTYIAGCVGVTMAGNVPRNNALAALKAESAEGAAYWPRYVVEWTLWNHVRTIACLAAMAAFIMAVS